MKLSFPFLSFSFICIFHIFFRIGGKYSHNLYFLEFFKYFLLKPLICMFLLYFINLCTYSRFLYPNSLGGGGSRLPLISLFWYKSVKFNTFLESSSALFLKYAKKMQICTILNIYCKIKFFCKLCAKTKS